MTADLAGLSCYTANLAEYLVRVDAGAVGRLARSVRLAVRAGAPFAFSHHAEPLHDLGEGRCLTYAGAAGPDEFLARVAEEVGRYGMVVVLADRSRMSWAVPDATPAPHYLLIDGHDDGAWRVVDRFTAVLPGGAQRPFEGWVGDGDLLACATPISPLSVLHRFRNEHAFGFAVPLPAEGTYQWLARAGGAGQVRLDGAWITGVVEVLEALRSFWMGLGEHLERSEQHDDLWAASRHHVFRYERLLAQEPVGGREEARLGAAREAWLQLPQALKFAADSAARGRPRAGLVERTFDALIAAERGARDIVVRHAYAGVDGR